MLKISPTDNLRGTLTAPPSKSHTLRALLFAAMANGSSTITGPLHSPDVEAMATACQALGATIRREGNTWQIEGFDEPKTPTKPIDARNSGQVLRFVGAVAGHCHGEVTITGDHSLQTRRPLKPLVDGLNQLGASAHCNGFAPLHVRGPMRAGTAHICGRDSQPVSGLLIAASRLTGTTTIEVTESGETPWLAVTRDWLERLGYPTYQQGDTYSVTGGAIHRGFTYQVPGDWSSAAYPLALGIPVTNLDPNDIQGDRHLLPLLQPGALDGAEVDVNPFIDALPLLAVLGCFAKGTTTLRNAAIARCKESDRLSAITEELRKMGAAITERPDGLIIEQSALSGAHLESHNDHRIVLSLAVAALRATGESTIHNTTCITKSYPTFVSDMQSLGALIE